MGRASPAISSFNAGEWAPEMEGRVDVEKYPSAARIQTNMIPLKQGPAARRPGFCFVQPVKNSANRTWLQRFEFSQTQAYQIEFGDGYCRFYTNHGPLLSTGNAPYNGATNYAIGDQATLGGICYYCTAPTAGTAPPNAAFWYAMTPYQGNAGIAIYEIPSPYLAADLTDAQGEFTLQPTQSGDVLYIAGGNASTVTPLGYAPYTLTRYANAPPKWVFARYAPIDGPFANIASVVPNANIALGVSAQQGVGVTITSYGGNAFAPTDVGRLVRIESQTFNVTPWVGNVGGTALGQLTSSGGNNYVALTAGTTGVSPPVHTFGAVADGPGGVLWLYTDSGYGVAQITGYLSPTQVLVTVLKRFPANCVAATSAVTAISQALPAVVTAANAAAAADPIFLFGVTGMVQVNQNFYVNQAASGVSVTLAGVDSSTWTAYAGGGTLVRNASQEWQLGAWSATTEWPRTTAFFKDRLFLAGKLNVWASVPGNYNSHTPDFFGQQTTDSAMNLFVTGSDASNIAWLAPAIILLIGTQGGEYGLDAANFSGAPLGPANVEILKQSAWRSRPIRPELVGTTLLYVQRAGRKVFAMDYNFYLNRYDSTDQNKFAYHITTSGLVAMAYQQEPWSVLWGVRADGVLASYTYNREDNVTGWSWHQLGGNADVESVSVTPAPDGLRDELWIIANRTVNGQTFRSVEYSAKPYEGPRSGNVGDAQSSAWYVDCGLTATLPIVPGQTTTTVTVAHLVGETVAILADGGVQAPMLVPVGGVLVLPGAFSVVTVGLPYVSQLVPMRFEGGADVGTAQGKVKQGSNTTVRLVDTAGGTMAQYNASNGTQGTKEPIQLNATATPLGLPPPIQSGDVALPFPHDPITDSDETDYYIMLEQGDPLPMTVVGLFPSYKVEEYT